MLTKSPAKSTESWLVTAPIQPLTPAETWIRKAQWLLQHAQLGAAKELVDKVSSLRP